MRGLRLRGFGLIEVLIAMGVSAILAGSMMSLFNYMFKSTGQIGTKMDREQIRQHFLRSVSCSDSLPGGTCTPTSPPTPLVVRNGATILATNTGIGTRIGQFTVRGECAPAGNGLLLRAVKLKASGTLTSTNPADFELDPVTKTPLTWADPRSLLQPVGIVLCGSVDIENRVAVLENLVTGLTAQVAALQADNVVMKGQILTLQGQVGTLQAQVGTLQGQVGTLIGQVGNMLTPVCSVVPKRGIGGFAANGTPQCAPVPGDWNGDGYADFTTGAWSGMIPGTPPQYLAGGPHLKIWSGNGSVGLVGNATGEILSIYAYESFFTGGVSSALVDVNGDGLADLVTGAGPGGGPRVKVYTQPLSQGQQPAPDYQQNGVSSFWGYHTGFNGGVMIGH